MKGQSGYNTIDGVYRSSRPPIDFPVEPSLSMTQFLFRNADAYLDRLAMADANSGQTFAFRDLRSAVIRVSTALSGLGVKKGDVVLIFAQNSIQFPLCFFGIIALGAIATTVNPVYSLPELTRQAVDSNATLVITVPELWDKVQQLRLPALFLDPKISPAVATGGAFVPYLSDLLDAVVRVSDSNLPPVRQTDVAALFYSSGTTGPSKGVVLTHRNFITAALMLTADQDAKGDPPNVFICCLPLFHMFGMFAITYAQLQRGNSVVIMERFDMDMVFRSVEKYKVSHLYVAPPVMMALVRQAKGTDYSLSSLRVITSGGAPLAKDIMEKVSEVFPQAAVLQGYGLTESCGVISLESAGGGDCLFGSTGALFSGIESKVISINTQQHLPPNQLGELCFRGPNIMQGYWKNEKATEETLDEEGWLHTGDLGYFDDQGLLYVVDRIKELIKYKGFQVAPAELEYLLLSHPEILDAVVIPFPDAEAGEVPIAYAVRSSKGSVTEEDVQKYIAKLVAPFKRLRQVNFINAVPRSPSGKILRRELIENERSKL